MARYVALKSLVRKESMMLNTNKYLDGAGVVTLWQRIQRLVYECAGKSAVTYRLESDGNTITLIGSDGTSSSVAVISTASCGDNNNSNSKDNGVLIEVNK